jgi:DNA modification methylase
VSKPYYDVDGVTLYHGDCREVLPALKAGAVVMDPPYNCGKNYGELTDDNLPWPEWCAWFDGVVALCQGVAPDVFSFLSQTAAKKYERLGVYERDWSLIWHKPLSLSICAAPFMPHWEPIFYFGKSKRTKDGGARFGSDVITANVETGQERWSHPTPKPIAVMLQLVEKVDGLICDPFAGSGTTLAAAKQLGRQAVGVEINESYCETIARRLDGTRVGLRARRDQGALPL